jgi:hypothetical protein
MPKKKSILRNSFLFDKPEFKPYFGGKNPVCIYALTYFPPDINDKLLVKVGMSVDIKSRTSSYHTAYPSMFHFLGLLRPDLVKYGRGYADKRNFLLAIEKRLIDILKNDKRVVRYKSPAQATIETSEWFYCKLEPIHDAFRILDDEYVTDKNKSVTFIFDYTHEDADKDDKEASKGTVTMLAYKMIKIK